ncbi:putative ATP-dependent endonuclease of OLD family [Rhizobium sp. SJZ105]|uniref:ATP-dependent nuclease n=1 Tax=Rhizobium sp. SJZ105 TaxID=2572678 RepID=UPI000E0F12BE|nr:ATP-binding protein [Rhizobium sp. SJZ105]TWC88880.1 putative ATP-dependent endonuclease of OLD family [Rhizobium sp. SJZ105]
MPAIRKLDIRNFRGIKNLSWTPSPGFNCLIGPGDSGKTSVLDAIDLCLGARRIVSFTDADFHNVDVSEPISITVVLGALEDALKRIDAYGDFLRGYNPTTNDLEEEPGSGLETTLCLRLTVNQDLEPVWTLESSRAAAKGLERNLKWADRESLSPLRLGSGGDGHLAWRRGSLLNKLSDEKPDTSGVLSVAARDARTAFGNKAKDQLKDAIEIVNTTAKGLGISVGATATAMLDIHSVAFGSGSISLHDESGVPLRGMGTGSKRLLTAGLHKEASKSKSIALIDEIETGLEPHRIVRFLKSLGSKDKEPTMQVFATSHSPIALQELSFNQVSIVRQDNSLGQTSILSATSDMQGALRATSSSFLAKSVLICEGKTEIGFMRGIDLFRTEVKGRESVDAAGVSLLDCDGGSEMRPFERAASFQALGYRVAIFIDNDRPIPEAEAKAFAENGGSLFHWGDGQSIEDAIICSATNSVILAILEVAERLNPDDLEFMDSRIKSASVGKLDLQGAKSLAASDCLSPEQKMWIAKAAGGKKGWFKDIGRMESLARDVIGPQFKEFGAPFKIVVQSILAWATK